MHLKQGVPKIISALTLVLALTLSACAPGTPSAERQWEELREQYRTMDSLEAEGTLTANYDDRVYTFSVVLSGDEDNGTLTVTAPENIAGSVIQWTDDALTLDVEDVHLETGTLSPDGLSPADALPAILSAVQEGIVLTCGICETETESLVEVELQNPAAERCTVHCGFSAENGALRYAELYEDGRRVITLELDSFIITPDSNPDA